MDDLHRVDGGLVAAVMGVVGTGWAMIRMFFNLVKRVEINEKDIGALKETTVVKFEEIREDIHAVSDRTEKRHDIIESKIDRLIERGLRNDNRT